MNKKYCFIFLMLFSTVFAAKRYIPQYIFSIDGEEISIEEFERVYTKNNINNQADYSRASLEEYLQLYVNFRLKVKEAEVLQLDQDPAIKGELETYRKQLAKNYLSDKEATENLLQEAYNRSQIEVDASHILIGWGSEYPTSADSARVLKEIQNIKKKAKYTSFEKLAKQYSEDPSAQTNEGRLGFLTVFQTVYPFESAMYNTEIDEISEPVATQFGYHLVYVHDKREARGKMTTAHILIKSKSTDTEAIQNAAEAKANQIYNAINAAEYDFEAGVKAHSEDKKTKFNKGVLPELSGAEMISSFADAAFSLEKDGDVSAPVQTQIGWHIIKRISKSEQATFDEMENSLKQRIERDSRSNVAKEVTINDTKDFFGFKENTGSVETIVTAISSSLVNDRVVIEDKEAYDKTIFSLGGNQYLQSDFVSYMEIFYKRNNAAKEATENNINQYYSRFKEQSILDYREANLEEVDVDFKNLMQEYHDGILLFELTDERVWTKAVEDTTGLKQFHKKYKMDYMWGERIDYTTYTTTDDKVNAKVQKFVAKGMDSKAIMKKLNKKNVVVKVVNGKHESGDNRFADEELQWEKGFDREIREEDQVHYTYVNKIRDPEPKELYETRGYVISDYQDYLEKEWLQELNEKYNVQINKYVLESLIKE